jgi:hypothetical protein
MGKVIFTECLMQPGMTLHGEKNNVIENVKLLGWESKNGRVYEKVNAPKWLPLYENAPVNLNHTAGGAPHRVVQERFGWVEGCSVKDDGIYADRLVFNPHSSYAEEFRWWATHNPAKLGMSHDAEGEGETKEGVLHVENVVKVHSVDLVADGATVKGLFEHKEPKMPETPATPAATPVVPAAPAVDPKEAAVKAFNATVAVLTEAKLTIGEVPAELFEMLLVADEAAAKKLVAGIVKLKAVVAPAAPAANHETPNSAAPSATPETTDLKSLATRLRS